MAKPVTIEDRQYIQKKNIYDSIAQAFSDLKWDLKSNHPWNVPVEKLNGIEIKFLNEGKILLVSQRIETGTLDVIEKLKQEGSDFLLEFEKQLKKKYKQNTKKALDIKKVGQDQNVEHLSIVQATTSWLFGPGYVRPVGRFLIKDLRVYDIGLEDS